MKQGDVVRKFGVVCALLLAAPCLLSSQVTSEVYRTIRFSQFDLSFSKIDVYDLIRIKETTVMSELGEPVLPVKTLRIAIPKGTKAIRVKAQSLSSTEILGDFYVMPGQPPVPIGQTSAELSVKPDDVIYNSSAAYPGDLVTLDHQGNVAGQQIVWVTVYPLQYVPTKRQLILHNRIELIVYCERDIVSENEFQERYYRFTENQRKIYEDMIKRMVVNPERVQLNPLMRGPSLLVPQGDFDHVIITSSALASYFQPLVYWHKKKGIRDTVVTTEWIYTNYTGPGDTLKIRQFVIDANTNWGTMYFLMGGEHEIVPFVYRTYAAGENTPSDQYYSDFDDDWIHEIFVGRATADNETQINTFINKVLKYEKEPPLTGYPLEVLLIGMDLDANTHGELLKELIAANYIPGNINIHEVYDSHGGNHRDSVLYYLNAGQNLVNHCDHSNITVMGTGDFNHGWAIGNSDVDNLTNDNQTSILVSVGCLVNAMDYNDCIAEHFVIYNDNQAGVAFTGNTKDGFYYSGNPYALSAELDKWWWCGLFTQNQDDLGKALVYSKHQFSHGPNVNKHCEWTFSLLGEPAMPIWTDVPDTMLVTYDPFVPASSGNFTVMVRDNDGVTPIENALVCCWIPVQTPEMYATEYTNASGQAVLSISPTTPGDTMLITVTKNNHLCYEGYAVVTVISGPFILTGSMLLDTGGDGQPNPGEDVDFGVWAKNIGVDTAFALYGLLSESDPFISISVDSSWYGDIPPDGDSSLSNPFYDFHVANNCPDGHVIDFTLEFHDTNDSTWISNPGIMVYAPVLIYQNHSVMTTYGVLYPGQTADLVLTLANEGGATAENITSTLTTSSSYITVNDSLGNFGTVAPGATGDNSADPYNITADISTPFETPVDFSVIVESGVYNDTIDFTLVVGQFVPTDTGYYYAYFPGGPPMHAPVFDWFAIDTTQTANPGVSLDLDRNQTVIVDLPFTFKYYGVDYNRISICSNGWIAMDSTASTVYANSPIPNTYGPPAMIAGLWDYLQPGTVGEPSDIYYYYDAANHRFIVEYFRVEHFPSGGYHETFEIILCDPAYYPTPTGDGEIIVQYLKAMQLPNSVTVGIEDSTQTVGIEYYRNGTYDSLAVPITDSFALKYTTHAPTGIEEHEKLSGLPLRTMLSALYPNPSTRGMKIGYQISEPSKIDLKVYDATGRLVRTLVQGINVPGYYTMVWDARDDLNRAVPAGVYFIRFSTDDYQKVEKAVLLR